MYNTHHIIHIYIYDIYTYIIHPLYIICKRQKGRLKKICYVSTKSIQSPTCQTNDKKMKPVHILYLIKMIQITPIRDAVLNF